MEEHGVTVGSVPFDATGRPRLELVIPDTDLSDPAQVGAMSACAWHLAQGALSLATEPVLRVALMESLAQFSGCVRDHGVGGFPHPLPMWFALDDDGAIRMTTFRASQKVSSSAHELRHCPCDCPPVV